MDTDAFALLMIAAVILLSAVVFLESLHRARRKLPLWRTMADMAHRNGFQLEESASTSYGVPEINGTVDGRPIVIRVTEGSASSPVSTAISVGHRFAIKAQVIMVRGNVPAWLAGSPRWKEARIGDSIAKRDVRITGRVPEDLSQVVVSLDERSRSLIVDSLYDQGVSWMRFYENRFDCYLHGLSNSPETVENGLKRIVELVASMESRVSPESLRPMPDDIHPSKPMVPARRLTSSLLFFVAVLGGLTMLLGIESGGTLLLQLAIAIAGACLVLVAASAIGSSMLREDEKRILDEFSTPPP